jgi:hypothetical protein
MSLASSFVAVRLTVVARAAASVDGLPGAGLANVGALDKIEVMTTINWSARRGFLVSLAIRAAAEDSCLAPGCAEAELRAETRYLRRSNGKVSLRDAVLRATVTVVQADERLNATGLMPWSFPGHWQMSSKLNELRPGSARSEDERKDQRRQFRGMKV